MPSMEDLRKEVAQNVGLNQNSIEVGTDSKGNPSYNVKIYFGNSEEERQLAQNQVLDFAEWFKQNKARMNPNT